MVDRVVVTFVILCAACGDSGREPQRLPRVVDVGGPRTRGSYRS